jgi:hypothetical protein
MTESQRALEVMGVTDAEQRRTPRRSVHAGGTISAGDATYVAWIKDINESGICLFTQHPPRVGENVRVTVHANRGASGRSIYHGTVIRIQSCGPGAAVVVAVLFSVMGAVFFRAA